MLYIAQYICYNDYYSAFTLPLMCVLIIHMYIHASNYFLHTVKVDVLVPEFSHAIGGHGISDAHNLRRLAQVITTPAE